MKKGPRAPSEHLLTQGAIHNLHELAMSAGLVHRRPALFVSIDEGFVSSIPTDSTPAGQLLLDLNALSRGGTLPNGSVPLAIWLRNAIHLAASHPEAAVFITILDRVERSG